MKDALAQLTSRTLHTTNQRSKRESKLKRRLKLAPMLKQNSWHKRNVKLKSEQPLRPRLQNEEPQEDEGLEGHEAGDEVACHPRLGYLRALRDLDLRQPGLQAECGSMTMYKVAAMGLGVVDRFMQRIIANPCHVRCLRDMHSSLALHTQMPSFTTAVVSGGGVDLYGVPR